MHHSPGPAGTARRSGSGLGSSLDSSKIFVSLGPTASRTIVLDDGVSANGASTSYAHIVFLVRSEEYDGPELDFNATVTYSVDGGPVRGPEGAMKLREVNELREVDTPGLLPQGGRYAVFGWSYVTPSVRNSICFTIETSAYWVATDQVAGTSAPLQRCLSMSISTLSTRDTGKPAMHRAEGGDLPFVRSNPAGMHHAFDYAPRGVRLQLHNEILVAPSTDSAADILESDVRGSAQVRIEGLGGYKSDWVPAQLTPLGPVLTNPLADGPSFLGLWGVHLNTWFFDKRILALGSIVHTRVVVQHTKHDSDGRAYNALAEHNFTQVLCTPNATFACEWSASAPPDPDNAQGGVFVPEEVACVEVPTAASVPETARAQGAVSPLAPLHGVGSLLRVDYESPGGYFVSCQPSDLLRREWKDYLRFSIDPYIGYQKVSAWHVRSVHLNQYTCNVSESIEADPGLGLPELSFPSCLGADNYSPSVAWNPKSGKTYTLMAWSADTAALGSPSLLWLVVDIPGTDVRRGTTLQRYIGPLVAAGFDATSLVSFAVYEQPSGHTYADSPYWAGIGLGPNAIIPEAERLGPAPVDVSSLLQWMGLAAPYAYSWFFLTTDLWTAFALEYVYGETTAAARLCQTANVNYIVNPVGGYCTNGFGAALENMAPPSEFLHFEDNGLNMGYADTCAAKGFHYPVMLDDGVTVDPAASNFSTVVPIGKTVVRFGSALSQCDASIATITWLGQPFCPGSTFALQRYYSKRSRCDWDSLVPMPDYSSPLVGAGVGASSVPASGGDFEDHSHEPAQHIHAAGGDTDPTDGASGPQGGCHREDCISAIQRCAGSRLADEGGAAPWAPAQPRSAPADAEVLSVAAGLACACAGAVVALVAQRVAGAHTASSPRARRGIPLA